MKGRPFIVLAIVLAAETACLSGPSVPVRVDMPGLTPFPPDSFTEIIVANFQTDTPPPDLDPGREFQAYLKAELSRVFKGTVSSQAVPADAVTGPADPAFWKEAGAGRDRAVFLTGSARLTGEVRKALQGKSVPVDGPFKLAGRDLLEQRHWTLAVDLFVISAATGEILYRKSFREERDYMDLEKPAEFGFSELSDRVRARLLPFLLGTSTSEPRALLKR